MTITDASTSSTSPDPRPADGSDHPDAGRDGGATAVVQALYGAFGQGDLASMLELIHPDVDWSVDVTAPGVERVPMLRNGRGHDAVRHYFSGVAQLEFHDFTPVALHEYGDVVLVELQLDLSHRSTGKRARFAEIHRFVVRDGLVVHYRPFADTAALIEVFRP